MLEKMLNRKMFKIAFWIAIGGVEYLATTSRHIELVESLWDKFNHFFAFGVLYILLSLGYSYLKGWQKASFLLLFGMQIEVVQSFLPSREFSMFDVVADTIGIIIGAVIYLTFAISELKNPNSLK